MPVYRHPYRQPPPRRPRTPLLVPASASVSSDVTTSAAVSQTGATDVTTSAALSIDGEIYVDDSVSAFNGTPINGTPITSGSFTPPNSSLLVVAVNGDTGGSPDNITISVSGGGLSWTNEAERDGGDAGASAGHASLWTAEVATGSSMTVSVTRTAGNGSTNRLRAKVYIVTGYKVGDPVGAVGEGSSATANITPNAYTSTADNSRGFGCGTDWNQLGLPTSSDVEDAEDFAGQISVIALYKAADTPTSGTVVTMNFQAGSAGTAAWNWVAIEVLPAPAGATVESDVTTSAAISTTNSASVTTSAATSRSEQIEVTTSAAVSQIGTLDVTTSAALSRTELANVTSDAATSRIEQLNVTTTTAASRTEQTEVTTSASVSRTEQGNVTTDASVTVAGANLAEVTTTAAITRVEQSNVTTDAALSQSGQANVTSSSAQSRTEQGDVGTSAATTRAELSNVASDAALSQSVQANVTTSAVLSRAEQSDIDTSASIYIGRQTDITSNAAISVQGQALLELETSASIGPPASILIDDRTLSASWIDDRTLSASWIDSRTIKAGWIDDRVIKVP